MNDQVIKTISLFCNENEETRLTVPCMDNLIEVFEYPLKSSFINIYKGDDDVGSRSMNLYDFSAANIKCKLLSVEYNSVINLYR